MAHKHNAIQLVAEVMDDLEQILHGAGIQPIVHHDILELVVQFIGKDPGGLDCSGRRLDRTKSTFTPRAANRLPILGASRLPRAFNGRSSSDRSGSSQLDFAWRTRSNVFMLHTEGV